MKMVESAGTPWTDEELGAALEGYLYLLQLEFSAIPFSITQYTKILLNGPLSERNDASLRYRMRNISFLMEEHGLPSLKAFSPAPQVGRNVKARLIDMLDQRGDSIDAIIRFSEQKPSLPSLENVLKGLEEIKLQLDSFSSTEQAGIGHNNPPAEFDLSEEFPKMSISVNVIKNEITKKSPNTKSIAKMSEKLVEFSLKLVVWSGQRCTDFAKAGAIAAGTGWGLSHDGLGQKILETIRSIYQLFP